MPRYQKSYGKKPAALSPERKSVLTDTVTTRAVSATLSQKNTPQLTGDNHVVKWRRCTRCALHCNATKHVLHTITANGTTVDNPRVLFLGEAPGRSEDIVGRPFIGPAGEELRGIIEEASPAGMIWSYVLTNPVACIPLDADGEVRKPKRDEMMTCLPRIVELMTIYTFDAVVLLGKTAETAWSLLRSPRFAAKNPTVAVPTIPTNRILKMCHPGYIIQYAVDPELEHKRCVLALGDLLGRLNNK